MKLAVVSTTIRGERGYLPFDRLAADSPFDSVTFVIAGDQKSVPFDASQFRCEVEYLSVQAQSRYKCSEPMGWNKIMRRNIALLRAMEMSPDFILFIDDDNIPAEDYFRTWYKTVTTPVDREVVSGDPSCPPWHNYLASSDAAIEIYPRGFPIEFRGRTITRIVSAADPIHNDRIGVYQGISLGDPDIDAITRIVYPQPLNDIKEKGYCCRDVWSPYNTQNTMVSKSLFPLAFVWPHCGRYDDIYASFVWQRLLFNRRMYAYVGDAVNIQCRGQRDILADLRNEFEGYNRAADLWRHVNAIEETDCLRFIQRLIESDNEILARHREFMRAYIEDLHAILLSPDLPKGNE